MVRSLRAAAPGIAGLLLSFLFLLPLRLAAQVPADTPTPDGIPLTAAQAAGAQVDVQPGLAPLVLAQGADALPDRYIVVFRPSRAFSAQAVRAKAMTARDNLGATVRYVYETALDGYTADLDPAALAAVRQDPDVAFVQQDRRAAKTGEQIQPPWNLDRIDQRSLPINGLYRYASTGAGVHVYIVDTGIQASHKEFAGRVGAGYDAVDGGAPDDCDGHGTHVAGIVGGGSVGVAKNVTLHAVRVLGCDGQGTASSIIAGLDWVVAHRQSPAVINMSLGGDASDAVDLALRNTVAAGLAVVTAAGNNSRNACLESPGREPLAINVGATGDIDRITAFSNFGPCLDLFAPGLNIRSSARGSSNEAYEVLGGTSMAAPHVAGAIALYLEAHPSAAPNEVTAAILNAATRGVVQGPVEGAPNLLLYMGSDTELQPTASPTPTPTTPPPTPGPTQLPPTPTATPRPPGSLTITAIAPNMGYNDAPSEVTIRGANFRAGVAGAIGTAPLLNVRLVSTGELRAVVPAGLTPGVYTLYLKNAEDREPVRLPDGYTVLAADSEDFWAAPEDLWTDPATVRQGQQVRLGLNVHRHGGGEPRAVEVRFYRLIARSEGGAEQLEEIGCVTSPPFAAGEESLGAVSVPWDTTSLPSTVEIVAIIDPDNQANEAAKSNNRVTRGLAVQPASGGGAAPILTGLEIEGGAAETANPAVTVKLGAGSEGSAAAASMYLVEREYVLAARQWVTVQSTGWLPYAPAHVMTLTEHGGLRFVQAWLADRDGNISPEAVAAGINYNPPSSSVLTGQVRLYRLRLAAGQALSVTLQPTAGDADLYIWAPDRTLAAFSNGDGLAADSANVTAAGAGYYQIEVYGYQDAAYGLSMRAADAAAAGSSLPAVVAPNKTPRDQPATAPDSVPAAQLALPAPLGAAKLYLPTIRTQ